MSNLNHHDGMQFVEGHGWLPVVTMTSTEQAEVVVYDRPNPYLIEIGGDSTSPWSAWDEGWTAHEQSLKQPTLPEAEDSMLYGLPGAEVLQLDPSTVYEGEDWLRDDDEWEHRESKTLPSYMEPIPPPDFSFVIEEWSTTKPRKHFPGADDVIDRVLEMFGDNDITEEAFDHARKFEDEPDVVAAFEYAIALLASKITYRMADVLLRTLTVTFDDNGEPLLDGEPMYVSSPVEPDNG